MTTRADLAHILKSGVTKSADPTLLRRLLAAELERLAPADIADLVDVVDPPPPDIALRLLPPPPEAA